MATRIKATQRLVDEANAQVELLRGGTLDAKAAFEVASALDGALAEITTNSAKLVCVVLCLWRVHVRDSHARACYRGTCGLRRRGVWPFPARSR